MDVVDITPPTLEPVSLERAKLFLRVEHDLEDDLIKDMIQTARLAVESYTGSSLITRERRMTLILSCVPSFTLWHHPIQSVQSLNIVRGDGTVEPILPEHYNVNLRANPAKISISNTTVFKSRDSHIEIDIIAGYGQTAADIPTPFIQAMLLLIAQFYERQDAPHNDLPMMVQALLMPYRGLRL